MTRRFARRLAPARHLLVLAAIGAVAGCADNPITTGTSSTIVERLFAPQIDTANASGSVNAVVYALDADGAAVRGAVVTWSSDAGVMRPRVSASDAHGRATSTWTPPTAGGSTVVRAAVRNSDGTSAHVDLTLGAPTAGGETLTLYGGDNQAARTGSVLAEALSVIATDSRGNPLRGRRVVWSAESGVITPSTDTTNSQGIARAFWRMGATPGPTHALASLETGATTAFSAVAVAAGDNKPARAIIVSGNNGNGPVGGSPPAPYRVRIVDADGQAVAGARVLWLVGVGGGSVNPVVSVTDNNGETAAIRIFGDTPGVQTTIAVAEEGSEASTFSGTAYARTTSERVVSAVAGQDQETQAGEAYATVLEARVEDGMGNPVAGEQVLWSASNGRILSDTSVTTDAQGIARARAAAGEVAGQGRAYFRAALAQRSGVGASWQLDVVAGRESSVIVTGGNNQRLFPGDTSAAISTVVLDRFGNVVAQPHLEWRVLSGDITGPVDSSKAASGEDARFVAGNQGGQGVIEVRAGSGTATLQVQIQPVGIKPAGATTLQAQKGDTVTIRVRVVALGSNDSGISGVIVRTVATPSSENGGLTLISPAARSGDGGYLSFKAIVGSAPTQELKAQAGEAEVRIIVTTGGG